MKRDGALSMNERTMRGIQHVMILSSSLIQPGAKGGSMDTGDMSPVLLSELADLFVMSGYDLIKGLPELFSFIVAISQFVQA